LSTLSVDQAKLIYMKTIGLIGGLSWESTQDYYRLINEGIRESLGGLHSAELILYSVDFEPIEQLQHIDDCEATAEILKDAAIKLEAGGAKFLLICSNTMHSVAPQVSEAVTIPLIHIADATAAEIKRSGYQKIGLLGTSFTMERNFYKGRLEDVHHLEVITPDQADRDLIHKVIYKELCLGSIVDTSKKEYLRIIHELADKGAEAVILGCTEIGMLVKQSDTPVPLLDTTTIHAKAAVQFALQLNGQ